MRTDPLADAAVAAFDELPQGGGFAQIEHALAHPSRSRSAMHPAIAALMCEVERVPAWVDFNTIDRAGELLLRAGAFGGLILGLQALPWGYASPAGNKPLALSGRLVEQAPRRLSETSRFVHAVCLPGGLRREADGFAICVKVRIMHARVRRLLWRSGKWKREVWGEPINQHDMAATTMLFSLVVLDGMRKLGFHVTDAEAQRYVQLWRYVGFLLGTDYELLYGTEAEGLKLADLIMQMQGPPDDDGRALTKALLEAGRRGARDPRERQRATRMAPFAYSLSRYLLGREMADSLGIPRSRLDPLMPLLRTSIRLFDGARARLRLVDALAVQLGSQYWEGVIAHGLGERPADFVPPAVLRSA
jgi:ER-bound oxygenase mpaB/B'/Rubber oxygenase, catalytic domain